MMMIGDIRYHILSLSKPQLLQHPPVSYFNLVHTLVEVLELALLLLLLTLLYLRIPLPVLDVLELFDPKRLAHQQFFLIKLLEQFLHFLYPWVLWIQRVQVVIELVALFLQTGNADGGVGSFLADHAFNMITVPTSKVDGFFGFDYSKTATFTHRPSTVALQFRLIIRCLNVMKTNLNKVGSNVEDVDRVRKVRENVGECLGHFSTHVQILILVLEKVNGVFNGTVGSQVFHHLTVNVEEDFEFFFWQVGFLVLVVELDEGVQEGFPDFF